MNFHFGDNQSLSSWTVKMSDAPVSLYVYIGSAARVWFSYQEQNSGHCQSLVLARATISVA